MRKAAYMAFAGLLVSASALADVDSPSEGRVVADPTFPRFTVSSLSVTAAASTNAPVIQSLTARYLVRAPKGNIIDIIPDIHFVAANGNAIVVHRELIDTSGAISQTQLKDATIDIPAAAQKRGAVISGGWVCGTSVYYVTIRAFIMDTDGNKSNAVEYTIHCNGG
jgi:hypothetical protein